MRALVVGVTMAGALSACASMGPRTELAPLPDHFTVRRDAYNQGLLDKATYEFPAPSSAVVFTDRVALCGMSNFSMDGFAAKQTTSWVGPATGNYYRSTQKDQVAEGQIVRFVSDSENVVLLANRDLLDQSGTLSHLTGQQDMFKDTLQYNVEARLTGETYRVTVSDIERATHETAGYENRGFMPIGAWPGGRSELYIPLVDAAIKRLNDCVQS